MNNPEDLEQVFDRLMPLEIPRFNAPAEPSNGSRPKPAERATAATSGAAVGAEDLEQILRLAAARGATTVYLVANAPASARINGELQPLDGVPAFTSDEIEMLLISLKVAQRAGVRRLLSATDWTFDLADLARVRCTMFNDQRGAGAVFELAPLRSSAADQIGLSLDVEQLAAEQDGLVLVAGPRGSGKLRVMHHLAELVARSRGAYVVTVQRGSVMPDDQASALISQRQVREGLDEMLAVGRSVLRENPDVLVLEEVHSAALLTLALDAAACGHLVIAGFTAPAAAEAVQQIVDLYPADQRQTVQLQLARQLRAVVGQVLVPKAGGGRTAAQEVLLMTPAVASLIADAPTWQLRSVLEATREHGLVPLSDVLVNLVWTGEVRPEDAYRCAPDRVKLLEKFRRRGIDTSFVDG